MNIIFGIVTTISAIGTVIGPIVAIVLAFKAHGEQDPILKKNLKHKAWWFFLGPIVLLIVSMSLFGLINSLSLK